MVQATVRLMDGMAFEATAPSGQRLVLDSAASDGGQDKGPRPLELLLVALGGCTGMDVISILRKKRQQVSGYEVVVRAERAAEHPMLYTSIHVEHVIRGRDVSPEAVARSIELSETKYCSVMAMLRPGTKIETSYRVIEE